MSAHSFPEEQWWRVAGRLGFPAWFFLAGYSKSTGVEPKLWAGAVLLAVGNAIMGQYIIPLNALFTYIAIRILMTPFLKRAFSNFEMLIYTTFFLVVLSLPTDAMFEYGTLAFMYAMFGYAVRNREELGINKWVRIGFCIFVPVVVTTFQVLSFNLAGLKAAILYVELLSISYLLYHFSAKEYPKITAALPSVINAVIRFFGRYTLEIYVIHLLIIKAILLYMHYGFYDWFDVSLYPRFPGAGE